MIYPRAGKTGRLFAAANPAAIRAKNRASQIPAREYTMPASLCKLRL